MQIHFKKLSATAITPVRAHSTDACFDLYADEDITIPYGETKIVPTNIAIELPFGYYADIRPRSGKTAKTPLRVHLGTIDAGYRDGLGIICENGKHAEMWNVVKKLQAGMTTTSHQNMYEKQLSLTIKKGEKIAQLLVQKLPKIELVEVDTLSDSDRGENGFGSTGNN